MSARPPAAEWSGDFGDVAQFPHGTPLMIDGKLQAGRRDARFIGCPDVHSDKAAHVVVASGQIAVRVGAIGAAAACDSRRIMILDDPTRDATVVHPNGRCSRRGCRELFADAEAASLSRRVAHSVHALMEAWTQAAGSGPLTAAEVVIYDGGALTSQHTAAGLAEARKLGLTDGRNGLWFATDRAWTLRRALEDRYVKEVD
jgi:hypothetical protein